MYPNQKMTRKLAKKCSLSLISWTTIQVFIFTACKMEILPVWKASISMEKHAFRSFFDFGYALTVNAISFDFN